MKLLKKLTAVALAVVMILAMGITASADIDVTMAGTVENATYKGYMLLSASTALINENCHENDADHKSGCYIVAYELNPKYTDLLIDETGKETRADIVNYIAGLGTAEAIRTFADNIFAAIEADNIASDGSFAKDDTGNMVFKKVPSGYWLFVENLPDNHSGAHSLVMLDTTGTRNITINTKRDEPTIEKQVRDNGTNYGLAADHQIGDRVNFQLICDVPDPIGHTEYVYVIHDKMDPGFTFDITSVEVRLNRNDGTVLKATEDNGSVNYSVVTTTPHCTGSECDFHVIVNIKEATARGLLKGDDRLYVKYQAVLNENAEIMADGHSMEKTNKNTAWIQYSNNPYADVTDAASGKIPETTTCEPATVYVRTFPLELHKVDSAGATIPNAKFVLSTNGTLTEAGFALNDDHVPTNTTGLIPLLKRTEGSGETYYRIAPAGYEDKEGDAYELVYVIDAGVAYLEGFNDQVEYYLYEIKNPAGYNKLNEPVSLKFFARYDTKDTTKLEDGYPKISVAAAPESAPLIANIVNRTGSELPATGGIGTTIFYVLGGMMVLGAVVLLITKKRMRAE